MELFYKNVLKSLGESKIRDYTYLMQWPSCAIVTHKILQMRKEFI